MKFNRQLLSKAISQEFFDSSPSNCLRSHVLDFVKLVGQINFQAAKKIDLGTRMIQYESIFKDYYNNDLIRSLCAGKDGSFSPIVEINNILHKQIQSPISALPERFTFKIIEPELDEVSRNTFQDETDVKFASYEFSNIITFSSKDFESSLKGFQTILSRNFEENDDIRLNFISSSRISNQYIVDYKIRDLIFNDASERNAFKNFLERFCFDIAGIRKVAKPIYLKDKSSIKACPKAVVIFIDSLDKRIFNNENILSKLPNFSKILNSCDYYQNFVSSADWTYPVMHSIFYGLSPAISLSTFRTYTPNTYSNCHPNKFSDASSFITFVQSIQPRIYSRVNSLNHLFSKLKRENIDTYSIRQSGNLSWLYSLTAQGLVTLEKNKDAVHGFKKITSKDDISNHLLWIDLDDLHKLDMPLSNTSNNLFHKDRTFAVPSSSFDRLRSKANEIDRKLYVEKVIALDAKLGEILNMIDIDVPVIIFSDHGSKAFSLTNDPSTGTLSYSRILNPTLLVSRSRNHPKRILTSIIESQDLHQLLLSILNIKSLSHSALDFAIPELYSYFKDSNSSEISYDSFIDSLESKRFALTMGTKSSNVGLDLVCMLTSICDGKKQSIKVSSSFLEILNAALKRSTSDLDTANLFYKDWTKNGVIPLLNTATNK